MTCSFAFDVHGWAAMTKKQKQFNQHGTRKSEINVQLKSLGLGFRGRWESKTEEFLFGNWSSKDTHTLAKKKTVSDGGFVFCFGFSCFSIFQPSTILFGSQNLSCFCALLFYLSAKNRIVLAIVYGPKFFKRKENPKQVSLEFV
jgi:hypothetical protein